jgi:hypothetical protein
VGREALYLNEGGFNTAVGVYALYNNTTADSNTAAGKYACYKSTGTDNIGLGYRAGYNLTTGHGNIDIGNEGEEDDALTIRIGTKGTHTTAHVAGIYNSELAGTEVVVDSFGQLGTITSSARFKENIQPMGKASDVLFALRPVRFRYKRAIDPKRVLQFGLVAEDVAQVAPELVVRDGAGHPYAVRYEAVNAMLLNEFLKTSEQIEMEAQRNKTQAATLNELRTTVAERQKQIAALTNGKERLSKKLASANPTVRQVVCATPIDDNTFCGDGAGINITTGICNSGFGADALHSETTGQYSSAVGYQALYHNPIGGNVALGVQALFTADTVLYNTAVGSGALAYDTTGNRNTALGRRALYNNQTGSDNIALGRSAGTVLKTGSNNIFIGHGGAATDEAGAIHIGNTLRHTRVFLAGVEDATVAGDALQLVVDSTGLLGVETSSARFKEDIQPMGQASEVIRSLRPVTFRYKSKIDAKGTRQFGLVAEQAAKVNSALVTRDKRGKPYTVRYQVINAMLLNEFLKMHAQVEQQISENQAQDMALNELRAGLVAQQKKMEALRAGLQTIHLKLEAQKPAAHVLAKN